MRSIGILLIAAVLAGGTATFSVAMSPRGRAPEVTLRGHLNTRCIAPSGGNVYVHMIIDVGAYAAKRSPPMNVAVVLDRSGSMEDERKMEYAKQAVFTLIDRLSSEDLLSIVIYDDRVETLLPSNRVTDRERMKRLVREVMPRGSTNLGGGMLEGFRQLESNFREDCTQRVILLSDGLANQGITDPYELNRIARQYRQQSISLTTIGVGLEYNENLMLGLAESGGGNYYFIEHPRQLASLFEREMEGLSSIAVRNAYIELDLGNGVAMDDVIGCEWERDGRKHIIAVGDLHAGEQRELTVELSLPEGTGRKHVADGVLRYMGDDDAHGGVRRFSVDILYTPDVVELERGKDLETQAKVDLALSTRTVERALESLDAGNQAEAAEKFREAKVALESSPVMMLNAPAAPMLRSRIEELEKYRDTVSDKSSDKRRTKKTIQYENYRLQKKK